jgi:hypothetical protein
MAFSSGQVDIGDQPAPICPVGRGRTIRVKNLTSATVYLGGEDVTADGYPLDGGESEAFTAGAPREAPTVPAPEGDTDVPVLYGRTGGGAGETGSGAARVAWISA